MTKSTIAAVAILFLGTVAQAENATPVFSCRNTQTVGSDATEFSMTVTKNNINYVAVLEGSSVKDPSPATRDEYDTTAALKIPGVVEILRNLNLSKTEYAKVAKVVVYTTGKFEDDAAGVRAIDLQDAAGQTLGSGMFFGWAGALNCR